MDGSLVASACRVEVNGRQGDTLVTFPEYSKGLRNTITPEEILIRLYDDGATVAGCSAFRAGSLVRISFGNPGQLDAGGVVTTGAGDRIRIQVSALDNQASHKNTITDAAERSSVTYPVDFAARGLLRFAAVPTGLGDAQAGEYTGELAFVISYE
ncbi:TPA: fimbrial protein [Citrobacter werkmanii]|nr:fimbrial protein [Citrobacter werkmanii]